MQPPSSGNDDTVTTERLNGGGCMKKDESEKGCDTDLTRRNLTSE